MSTSGLHIYIYILAYMWIPQPNAHMYTQEVRYDFEITRILTIAKCLLRQVCTLYFQVGINFVIRLSDNQVIGLLVSATISN